MYVGREVVGEKMITVCFSCLYRLKRWQKKETLEFDSLEIEIKSEFFLLKLLQV